MGRRGRQGRPGGPPASGRARRVGPIALSILYRDEHVVCVDKPSGMPVHRSKEHARVREVVLQTLRDQLGVRLNPVHRLDRATSGVLIMAFGAEPAAAFAAALAEPATRKEYLAVVRGRFPDGETVIDRPLTNRTTGRVQDARTEVRRLGEIDLGERFGPASVVRATIRTGRRHQIRRHLSHLRHQILVDSTYGKGAINRHARSLGFPRLCLHHRRLRIAHPVTGVELVVEAPLPPDLGEPLARCGASDALLSNL